MTDILTWLTEPFQHSFYIRAVLASFLVLVAASILGFGILTKKFSYLGQGVSQSMLAGIAIGTFAGSNATLSAFVAAIISAVLIANLGRVRGLGADAAVAIVASTGLSLGVALISADRSRSVNLTNLLFGNVLGVTWPEVVALAAAATVATTFSVYNGRKLALSALSSDVATAHGIAVKNLEMQRLVVISLVTSASVQVVGVTLVVAALVIPAATAALVTSTVGGAHTAATAVGAFTALAGLYISYWFDVASGPAVVLTSAVLYTIALLSRFSSNTRS
jgi:manganese/iron transport system permease protein